MKKFLIILLVCLISFLTTGCQKFDYSINIDKNGKIEIAETITYDKAILEKFPEKEDLLNQEIEKIKLNLNIAKNEVSDYEDDKYKGIRNVSSGIFVESFHRNLLPSGFFTHDEFPLTINSMFLKKVYKIDLNYNIGTVEHNYTKKYSKKMLEELFEDYAVADGEEEEGVEELFIEENILPEARLAITIPYRAFMYNANSETMVANGYRYEWVLPVDGQTCSIKLVYEENDFRILQVLIVFGVIILVMVVFVQKLKDTSGEY